MISDFVKKDSSGNIDRLLCKVCGVVIASTQDVVADIRFDRDGNKTLSVKSRFVRHSNYTELRMRCQNGSRYSYHITHGCKKCLSLTMPVDTLKELYRIDIEEQRDELSGLTDSMLEWSPVEAVSLKVGGGIA